jgi:lysophospholipase L1-like esterase
MSSHCAYHEAVVSPPTAGARSRIRIIALLSALALSAGTSVHPAPNLTEYPNSMAATGDSITRAYNTGTVPFSDAIGNSWSTGARTSVQSHYSRILSGEPAIVGWNFNDAVSGAKIAGLEAQVRKVNDQKVAYVTILIGANDLCTGTVQAMTSVADFRFQLERAMAALSAGSPRARIYVVSIPNVYRLWRIFKDDLVARLAWRSLDICQSLLARPRSTNPSDVARRAAVRQRAIDFNEQLAEVCALYIHCRFDQYALFADRFGPDEVSRRDYFHPSLQGQARLAQLTWGATFDFTDQLAPITTASTAAVEGGTLVSLDATDDVDVAGIEYRLNLGAWQRYEGPFVLPPGGNIRFRAVDVNGNTETTQSLTA